MAAVVLRPSWYLATLRYTVTLDQDKSSAVFVMFQFVASRACKVRKFASETKRAALIKAVTSTVFRN